MVELVQENWVLLVLALVVGLFVAWWLFAARRTRVQIARSDADGVTARRNQALIDAPPAAAFTEVPPPTPEAIGGAGVAVAVAADMVPVEPVPVPAPGGAGDDLLRIKGLGPKIADQLHALGVTTFAQIAAWDDAKIDRIDAQLGRFQGRIRRDDWPAQARLLAAGDTAGYEAKFGKL